MDQRAPLPPLGAPWNEIEAWCFGVADPEGDPRSVKELAAIAFQAQGDMGAASINDLRGAAYFAWRRWRWNDGVSPEDERAIRAVIEELRRRLTHAEAGLE